MKSNFLVLLIIISNLCHADTWLQKASITGARDGAVGFSIGNKGYIGTGFNSGAMTYYHDFWEFNPDSNIWTQKADFGGGDRSNAVGFSIGDRGYIGTGLSHTGHQNDFWEWEQASNTWIQKTNFPGVPRLCATGFSIDNKAYIGLGTGWGATGLQKDFWEWDSDTLSATYNIWTQKTDFGGTARTVAIGFSIGTKGYIGTGGIGQGTADVINDFWEWDGDTSSVTYNTWLQKTDFGGGGRSQAVGFSIGTKGYVGTGSDSVGVNKKDFWEYDAVADTWTQKTDFGGFQRDYATGFSIGNKGYIGMGFFFTVSTNDFWEYCDTCSGSGINELFEENFSVFPNPAIKNIIVTTTQSFKNIKAQLYNAKGQKIFQKEYTNIATSFQIDISPYNQGIYFLQLTSNNQSTSQKIIIQK